MSYNLITAIRLSHRTKNVIPFQSILTKYGCIIKLRLGLHETADGCSLDGLIILQIQGDQQEIEAFMKELNEVEGVTVKSMEI